MIHPLVSRLYPPPSCATCDGTGLICYICGETEFFCECPDNPWTLSPCDECGGTGEAAGIFNPQNISTRARLFGETPPRKRAPREDP